MAPLIFVLAITIGKEAYDDYKRYLRDRESNGQLFKKLTIDGSIMIPSSDICIGDVIELEKNQRVPADMILLRTLDRTGTVFIRTDQLDGEIDWKVRVAIPMTQKLGHDSDIFQSNIVFYADRPHKDIHVFEGNCSRKLKENDPLPPSSNSLPLKDGEINSNSNSNSHDQFATESLSVENTLWMNTVVATGHAIGVVVYTGKDTRAVMNTSNPKTKMGLTDSELNRLSKILCFIVLIIAILMLSFKGFHGPWYIYLIRFIVLFSSIIPISLRVNLDMGKTACSAEIMNDKKIPEVIVRTSTIPEELGRIHYLLSDKTGTLTKNDMELKRVHIGSASFGPESHDQITSAIDRVLRIDKKAPFSPFTSNSTTFNSGNNLGGAGSGGGSRGGTGNGIGGGNALKTNGSNNLNHRIFDVIQALALCHNVTPSIENDKIYYQASSPDEVAIVKWTEKIGLILVFRDREKMKLTTVPPFSSDERASSGTGGNSLSITLEFDILHIFPFTSETKRMGIVIRDASTQEIFFLEKGADAVMTRVVQQNDWLEEECSNMAREGLRTLVFGRKRLSIEEYEAFNNEYHEAKIAIQGRNEKIQKAIKNHLECNLELLAVTGVEDKLQDDVRGTIEMLRNANIKVWMLTGDKVETASNIAISTRLFRRDQRIYQVQRIQMEDVHTVLNHLRSNDQCALVIDGPSLQLMMEHAQDDFMEWCNKLPSVVCCRCTPTQKADVARMIQKFTGKRVMCIGDGGNDVSMIQAGNVGVGIVGKEGRQASLAADFSVTQFSHIKRLILWHGRNSYKRISKISLFVIHRGFIIAIMQAVFSALFYFSPIALYQGIIAIGYATIYTMAPVFSLVLDRDITDEMALVFPELYKELQKGRELSSKAFFKWITVSIYQGGTIMLLAIWLFESEFIHIVSITFTALILNELLMVALEIQTWHYLMGIAEIGSFLVYIMSVRFLKSYFDITFTTSSTFFWKVGLITVVSFLPLYLYKLLKHIFNPPSSTKLLM